MREVRAGLEIGGRVYYPVTKVDRSRSGWVKVTVGNILPDRVPNSPPPRQGDAGVLSVVTPRQNVLNQQLGHLDRVFFANSGLEAELLWDFWFKEPWNGKVIQE